jgi:hypothetical protein
MKKHLTTIVIISVILFVDFSRCIEEESGEERAKEKYLIKWFNIARY